MEKTQDAWNESGEPQKIRSMGWKELWLKEDWWAIYLGLGIIAVAYLFFANGSSIKWIAITPPAKWTDFSVVTQHFADHIVQYIAQFVMWSVVFGISIKALRFKLSEFYPSFLFIYIFSIIILVVGQNKSVTNLNLEPPLLALLLGLIISNFIGTPKWMDTGFRVEFYVKTGIVLLGATLPFTLIVWAGPTAIVQASIVSITTFSVIFFTATKMGLDRRLAATMGAGGAVCGVSGAIAIAGAVGAKKEHAPIAISLVIVWAIVMIFVLPLVSKSMHLPVGVAGAWIGTSEFADAAGFAAASTYDGYAGQPGIAGNAGDAVQAFTLMKVVGRDVWIGIWAFVLALIATTRWEVKTGTKPNPAEIWWRFPKFVFGFALASIFVTLVASHYGEAVYGKVVKPEMVIPILNLRTWAFIFCFFSIGLTTRFRELVSAGRKPLMAFTTGVVVNVILGFILSTIVFVDYWSNLSHH
ncbi:MAG: putative sulfate exporter family transporter [Gallionella sp.]